MDKKTVGIMFIILAVVVAIFTLWVTEDLKKLNQYLHKDCTLPADVCPFNTLLPSETIVGLIISVIMAGIGLYLIVSSKKDSVTKFAESRKKEDVIKTLAGEEVMAYNTILSSGGTIFQSELVEKSGLDKVKISRVLDRLEGKGLIERKRRGMSNVIVLRH